MVDTSIVIGAFNEEENVEELYSELTRVMRDIGVPYELLFIDDGSTDRTFELLRKIYESDQQVRVIRFGRNFGQQVAIAAGLKFARGKIVILIDADLQTPPSEIPRLRDKLLEGHDIVYGVRSRNPVSWYRRIGSRVANRFVAKVAGLNVPDGVSSFLALDRKLVDEVNLFNEKTKYISGHLGWLSYGRYAAIPVERRPRERGKSKYTLWRLIGLTINLVTLYSTAPLVIASFLGFLFTLCGAVLCVWSVVARGLSSVGTVIGTVILFSGVQLLCVGILGEYVGRIYGEVRERPSYVIREVLDHGADVGASKS